MPKTTKVTKTTKAVVKKTVAKPKAEAKDAVIKAGGLMVEAYSVSGKTTEKISLPKEIFGGKINKTLMAQAVRVYLANQRQGNASTKTRGEVDGSTRKIYRQKGTGRARHGGIRAPIFVGGGIAMGPKPHDFSMSMPKKMRKAALISALSSKFKDGEIKVLSGLDKIEPKTKIMAKLISTISENKKGKTLLITSGSQKDGLESLFRAARNIKNLDILSANLINTYEVLDNKQIFLMKQAIEVVENNLRRDK